MISSVAEISDETSSKKFKACKNPDVDTSFLPDREREEEENKLREELRQVEFSAATYPFRKQCS